MKRQNNTSEGEACVYYELWDFARVIAAVLPYIGIDNPGVSDLIQRCAEKLIEDKMKHCEQQTKGTLSETPPAPRPWRNPREEAEIIKGELDALNIDETLADIGFCDTKIKKPCFAYDTLDFACQKYWLERRLNELRMKEVAEERKKK